MRRESVAQMLLSLFVGPGRAASIVGDLLEHDAAVRNFRFWYFIAQIAIRSLAKPVLALVLAILATAAYIRWVVAPSITAIHPFYEIDRWLGSAILLLFIAAAWCVVKYGWRDVFTLSILAFVSLGTIGLRFRWIFLVAPAMAVLAACIVILAFCYPRGRRTLLAVMLTIIGSELAFASVAYLDRRLFVSGWFSRSVNSFLVFLGAIFLIALIFMVTASSRRITIEKPRSPSAKPAVS